MDSAIRDRPYSLLEKDSSSRRRGSKLREKVQKILRHEQDNKDQRTASGGDGGKPMGKVARPLETADLNPTAERDSQESDEE